MVSSHELDLLGKAVLAAVFGFAVGWEREAHGHPAGTRTLALICMGATILTGLGEASSILFPDRIIQGIAQGVGVLGAGLIIHARHGGIQGLTTAATMWTVASIGVVVGSGFYLSATLLTGLVLLLLWWPSAPALRRLKPRERQRESAQASSTQDKSPDAADAADAADGPDSQ